MQKYIYSLFLNSRFLILVLIIASSLQSCKDFIEEDITNQKVNLIIPQNNYTTPNRTIQFKWDEIDGASDYSIQIVSPSFSNIISFTVDSIVSNSTVYFNLTPGEYEWRVKANNYNSSTLYSLPYKLTIDTSSDLVNQSVMLTSPTNGFVSNLITQIFSWQAIDVADDYDFILKLGNDFNTGTTILSSYDMTSNQYTTNSLNEGEYVWGVRAKNGIPSLTSYSTFDFYIDTTKPQQVNLVSPANNYSDNDSTSISFSWNRPSDIGIYQSNITDIFEVYSDSLITLYDTLMTSGANTSYTFNQTGTYFWRVISKDEATNESLPSAARKITIIP